MGFLSKLTEKLDALGDKAAKTMAAQPSYIDKLKQANPEAYKKLEGLMAYSANEGNNGIPQDWQAQIFTPLQAEAPKKIETGKYVDVPEVAYDGEMVPYPTGRTIKQWVQSAPEGYTPTVVEVGGDTTQLATTGYTKDLGKINGLPVTAQYDLQGNLTGYVSDPRYRNWLSGSTGVSGQWDASGAPNPAQHVSSSGGFFSGLAGGLGDLVGGIGDAFGDLYMTVRDPIQAAGVVAGNYILPGSSLVTSRLVSDNAQEMLNTDVGRAANIGAGIAGGLEGNVSNYGKLGEAMGMTSSSADAMAADNIDMGGGWNPATGMGDPATAAAAAATGVTSSASTPRYGMPDVSATEAPSAIEKLTQLAADNPLTTAGIAALAAPAVLGGQQPAQPEAPPPTPITYNINPYEFQRTYLTPENMVGKQYAQGQTSGERNWVTDTLTPLQTVVKTEGKAAGGKISSNEGLMNLHSNAQQIAEQGRYGDDMLVHMNRDEVAGLEALAREKGTHLTRNPETGMPEAFGLGDLNPVRIVQGKGAVGEALGPAAPILAGVALGPAGFGLMGAGAAGLTVGGITALASGNLQKGLMAGLGAYGGAAISGSLASMGASSIGDAAKAETLLSGGSEAMAADNAKFAVEKAGVLDKLGAGTSYAAQNPTAALKTLGEGSAWKGAGILGAAAAPVLAGQMVQTATPPPQSSGLIRPYQFNRKVITPTDMVQPTYQQGQSTRERNWFEDTLTPNTPYAAPGPEYKKLAVGGPVEAMSNANAVGANTGFPQADITGHAYSTPWQTPVSQNVVQGAADTGVDRITGEMSFAAGGLPSLGGYASGGNPRLLKGPGDGMSDNIPAVIGGKQPARLADGEFVVPADVVSHLGNGSTEAGAKQLYKMMDRIRQKRTGKKRQAPEVNPMKALPA